MQKRFLLDVSSCSEYACVKIAPGNVLCHHSKHLMLANIWWDIQIPKWLKDNLPFFEYFRKIGLTTCLRKGRWGRDSLPSSLLIRCNTHAPNLGPSASFRYKRRAKKRFFKNCSGDVVGHAPWRTTSTIQTNGNHHHFFIRIMKI